VEEEKIFVRMGILTKCGGS